MGVEAIGLDAPIASEVVLHVIGIKHSEIHLD